MNNGVFTSMFKYFLSLILAMILFLGGLLWWAIGDSLPKRTKLDLSQVPSPPKFPAKEEIVVATYNIGHGQGIKERAWDHRAKETTIKQLNLISDAMNKLNADIFLLQEVDLDSNRTQYINQIEFLKNKTNHPYYACAVVWEKNYVPFPFWPPAHHIGNVKAANCILSRYPLSNHERIIFDKPESNAFWYNWGYIDRGIQRVDVQIGEKTIAILNLHLEAWEKEARQKQIEVTKDYMKEISYPIILGGDFNTVPPYAKRKNGFTDDEDADYGDESTLAWFYKDKSEFDKRKLIECPKAKECFTFPANNPDRKLDHLFLKELKFLDYRVGYEAGVASDHLPVIATIDLK